MFVVVIYTMGLRGPKDDFGPVVYGPFASRELATEWRADACGHLDNGVYIREVLTRTHEMPEEK